MFSVKFLGQNSPSMRPIASGLAFGFIDLPLHFEILSEGVSEPFTLNFYVRIDSKRKPLELSLGSIEGAKKDVVFWNPSSTGTSGLAFPISVLQRRPDYVLGFMFQVDRIGDNRTYRLTYEFYDGMLPHSQAEVAP